MFVFVFKYWHYPHTLVTASVYRQLNLFTGCMNDSAPYVLGYSHGNWCCRAQIISNNTTPNTAGNNVM